MPEMTPVSSSLIQSIGYDQDTAELHVVFKNGDRYIYSGVPETKFEGMMEANSAGRYFLAMIRDVFPYRKEMAR